MALAGGWPTVRHEVDLARAEHLAARRDPQARHVAAEALARAESDGYVLHAARRRQLAGSAARPGPRGYRSPAS